MKKKKRPLAPPPLKSLKRARQITSAFHVATRELDEALVKGDAAAAARARAAVEAAGGRETYQAASAAATGRHRTAAKFVWSHLTRLGYREKKHEKKGDKRREKPRLLEIGAINTQLLSTPWLSVRSVDLRAPASLAGAASRRIETIDFFDVSRLPQRGEYDAVVCSMVLNCLTTPEQRGEMLRGIRRHLRFDEGEGGEEKGEDGKSDESASETEEEQEGSAKTRKKGLAFIMLPRRCVEASRACDWERLESCMARAGLGEVLARKASAKVAFWLARATAIPVSSSSSSDFDEGKEDASLIAAAHAAGEFAIIMKEAGGEKEKKKKKKKKNTKNRKEGS